MSYSADLGRSIGQVPAGLVAASWHCYPAPVAAWITMAPVG